MVKKYSYTLREAPIVLGFLIFFLFGACRQNDSSGGDLDPKYREKTREVEMLNSVWDFSLKVNNTKINPDVIIENFYSGKKIRIGDFLTKRKVLVLQYSELNCNTCIDSAVNEFKNFSKKINDTKDLILIASSTNRRLMASFVHMNNWKLHNLFMVDQSGYNKLYKQTVDLPFLYVTNSELIISDAFIPHKELPQLTKDYYHEILNKYYNL